MQGSKSLKSPSFAEEISGKKSVRGFSWVLRVCSALAPYREEAHGAWKEKTLQYTSQHPAVDKELSSFPHLTKAKPVRVSMSPHWFKYPCCFQLSLQHGCGFCSNGSGQIISYSEIIWFRDGQEGRIKSGEESVGAVEVMVVVCVRINNQNWQVAKLLAQGAGPLMLDGRHLSEQ